jgi:hypothetical protein
MISPCFTTGKLIKDLKLSHNRQTLENDYLFTSMVNLHNKLTIMFDTSDLVHFRERSMKSLCFKLSQARRGTALQTQPMMTDGPYRRGTRVKYTAREIRQRKYCCCCAKGHDDRIDMVSKQGAAPRRN